MAIHSLSQYLSLAETLTALGVPRDNFRRAIEEGYVSLHAYLRSGPKPFLADCLSGLFHEPDSDKMNGEVAGYLNCDKTNGGARLIADLLDTRKDGVEWNKRHNLRSKLYLLKPWEGRFIAFRDAPLWGDWQSASGIQGMECVIHPGQLGDDDVTVEGFLLNHIHPDGPSDPAFPHFMLFGTVRLSAYSLIRWARAGRFVSPVRVTPLSWWTEARAFVPWTNGHTPKNYFALRYPTTEGYTDVPPASLSFVPTHGWHDTPTDDDLLFRREDVEAIQKRMLSATTSGPDKAASSTAAAVSTADNHPSEVSGSPRVPDGRSRNAIGREIEEAIARIESSGTCAVVNQHDVMAELAKRAGVAGSCITGVADGNTGILWRDDQQQPQKLTKEAIRKRLARRTNVQDGHERTPTGR